MWSRRGLCRPSEATLATPDVIAGAELKELPTDSSPRLADWAPTPLDPGTGRTATPLLRSRHPGERIPCVAACWQRSPIKAAPVAAEVGVRRRDCVALASGHPPTASWARWAARPAPALVRVRPAPRRQDQLSPAPAQPGSSFSVGPAGSRPSRFRGKPSGVACANAASGVRVEISRHGGVRFSAPGASSST